jgi:uncharacterized protein
MLIKNKSQNTILSTNAKFCRSLWDKSMGLLNPKNPRILVFKTRFGLHTFFLKEPIDVVVLNNEKEIVDLIEGLKPNQLFFWNPLYDLVIELPAGTISKSKTAVGDELKIEE